MVWKHQVGGAMSEQPTFEDGILYVGAFDGKVYAIDADTGEAIPGFDFQAENWVWSKVFVADGQLYVTALDGKLYALDPATGAVTPPYPYDSGESENREDTLRASPVKAGEYIVIASEYGQVTAVQDARRHWLWPSGVPQAGVLTTPVVSPDGSTVYVVLLNGQVQALDAETGVSLPGWPFVPPTED
jgi:outer membrane protein assembly factor BamB